MTWPMIETIGLLATILYLLYYYYKSSFDYWRKQNVKGPKPIPFFGNTKDVYLGKISTNDCFTNAYYEYKDEPMIGIFDGPVPILILRDPDLIKDVLIKDFPIFADRIPEANEKVEPLSAHLFRIEAKRWKPLRARFSPVFSSGKLKEMFYLLLECGNHFEEYLRKLIEKEECVACREISAKFTTDVIGSCGFGIEMNALAGEDSEFRNMGRKIFQTDYKSFITDRLRKYPFLFKIIGPFLTDKEVVNFFTKITKESIDYRIQHNIHRHDFIDALVDLKKNPGSFGKLDDIFLAAQVFVFFAAGFETSSITIAHALYELASNPTIQEKLRAEIKDILQRNNDEITYDGIKEMKYLDAVFQETLRKYPVVLWLSRKALSEYTFSSPKVTIRKDQVVIIPAYAIHHDPSIFPDPEVFDPNRFIDADAKIRHPMFYLPFGDGPRNCIGARFAKIQSKVAMIKILSNFKIDVCEKTAKTYIRDKKSLFLLQPTHEIYLKMTKV